MDAIAKAENVEVTDEEIEAEYDKMAEQYGMKAEDLKKYITADGVKSQLTNQKVVKIVVDSAKATKPEEKDEAPRARRSPRRSLRARRRREGGRRRGGPRRGGESRPRGRASLFRGR